MYAKVSSVQSNLMHANKNNLHVNFDLSLSYLTICFLFTFMDLICLKNFTSVNDIFVFACR